MVVRSSLCNNSTDRFLGASVIFSPPLHIPIWYSEQPLLSPSPVTINSTIPLVPEVL